MVVMVEGKEMWSMETNKASWRLTGGKKKKGQMARSWGEDGFIYLGRERAINWKLAVGPWK